MTEKYHEILFIALALVSEVLGTVTGFGSSTFFVPIAQFLETLQVVLVITGFLHIFGNIFKLILFKKINWKILIVFGLATIIPVSAGAWMSNMFAKSTYEIIIGSVLLIASTIFLLKGKFSALLKENRLYQIGMGIISGFLTGLIGTGGAIRGLALSTLNLEKEAFISTSAAIDLLGDIDRTIVYLSKGYLNKEHLFYFWFLIPIAFLGTWFGKKIVSKFSETVFSKIVIIAIATIGLTTLIQGIINAVVKNL